jgi:hypothetical protein
MNTACVIENLESRTLLSATPPVLFNATIKLDRLVIRMDLIKFRFDAAISNLQLAIDRLIIRHNTPKGDTSLDAPFTQLRTDVKSMSLQLAQDRLNEAKNVLNDELTIKQDILQIRKDRGNDSALTADHDKLKNDRIQMQTDLVGGLDMRIATRQTFETTISNDTQAIITAATNDANATNAMSAAVTKFSNDRITRLATLTADLQKISTDRHTLVNDLTAAQTT